jgi:predicted RNA binding protein YcfA (HicA-like mRNA interferase family)
MKTVSGRRLCKILEKKGWSLKTVYGSHYVYMKEGRRERISVPVYGNKDLKSGLLTSIMKLADIQESDLQDLTAGLRIDRHPLCNSRKDGLAAYQRGFLMPGATAGTPFYQQPGTGKLRLARGTQRGRR